MTGGVKLRLWAIVSRRQRDKSCQLCGKEGDNYSISPDPIPQHRKRTGKCCDICHYWPVLSVLSGYHTRVVLVELICFIVPAGYLVKEGLS